MKRLKLEQAIDELEDAVEHQRTFSVALLDMVKAKDKTIMGSAIERHSERVAERVRLAMTKVRMIAEQQ